jgi:hypothetical protein
METGKGWMDGGAWKGKGMNESTTTWWNFF